MTGTAIDSKYISLILIRTISASGSKLTTHGNRHVGTPRNHELSNIFQFVLSDPIQSLQEGFLPSHQFDDLHAAQKLLQESGSLVRPDHGLFTNDE